MGKDKDVWITFATERYSAPAHRRAVRRSEKNALRVLCLHPIDERASLKTQLQHYHCVFTPVCHLNEHSHTFGIARHRLLTCLASRPSSSISPVTNTWRIYGSELRATWPESQSKTTVTNLNPTRMQLALLPIRLQVITSPYRIISLQFPRAKCHKCVMRNDKNKTTFRLK